MPFGVLKRKLMTVFISVGRPIDTPMFEGDSYMSLPGIEGAVLQLKFSIRFLALKSGNMLLLYNGQTIFPGRGDFISLAIWCLVNLLGQHFSASGEFYDCHNRK